jgi:hypothetical protein
MIPAKIYLPTSTLNFNSIMSSESVSPASFYLKRGFGYKRFEKVNPNRLDNRIVLYPKYPIFDIADKELENYPMVIELESKTLKEDIVKEVDGLFYVDETIYLNPFSTKIIFRNTNEKISTISKAEPSIETKMVLVYENSFTEIENEPNIQSFKWEEINIADSKEDISKYISEDRKINKLKGLLYAYLIASNKSVSQEIVALKKNTRILQNILSAIITSPDNRPTYSQQDHLNTIYNAINNKLQSIFLSPIIKEKSEKYQCDFFHLLKQENIWEYWLRQNNYSRYQITPFLSPSKDKDKALSLYMQNLENQIYSFEFSQKKSKCNLSNLPELQFKRIINIPEQKDFLIKLFNEYLEEAYTSDEFIQSRYEFAKSGGKIFKEELNEKWDGSQWQQYINALLKNLNEFSAFDLKSINNNTLESFAAFCQKGDSDIDKLEDYLISNEIGDYRIAISLWGIIFGFANMPKTFTNEFFLIDDLDYTSKIYMHIFNQLHSIKLEGSFKQNSIKNESIQKTIDIQKDKTINETNNAISQSSNHQEIRLKLNDCKLKSEQLDSITEIYEKNHYLINDKFFSSVNKIRGIGKKAVEKIKEALAYEPEISKSAQAETSLFDSMKPDIGKDFYSDSSVFFHIEKMIPQKLRKPFKTDLDWFQEEYIKGPSSQYYAKALRDNPSVIDSFERYISKKKYAKQIEVESIVRNLKELYLK